MLEPLLKLPQVRAATGLSTASIYRKMAAGDFPKPKKLGLRAVAWPESRVRSWLESRPDALDIS